MEALLWVGLLWLVLRGRQRQNAPQGHMDRRNEPAAEILAQQTLRRSTRLRVPGSITTGRRAGIVGGGSGGGGGGSGGRGGKQQFTP